MIIILNIDYKLTKQAKLSIIYKVFERKNVMEDEKELLNDEIETKEESLDENKDDAEQDLEDLVEEKEKPLDEDELSSAVERGDEYEESENTPMDAIVEIETKYDYKTLKYTNMYVIRVKRKSRITNFVMMIASILLGTYIGIWGGKYFYFGIVLGVLGLWMLYNILSEEHRIDKQLKKHFLTRSPLIQTFLINDDKVRVIAQIGEKTQTADYPWAYVQSIDVIPEYIFLFVNGGAPLVLDSSATAFKKGTMEELRNILKEEASLKPYKFYEKKFFKNHNFDIEYPVTLEEKEERKDEE